MIKESERTVSAAFFIINEEIVFGGEGFALTEFGSNLQAIFIIRKELNELAKQDGAVNGEVRLSLGNEVKERCNHLGIPRQDKFLDVLERGFVTIVRKREYAAISSIFKKKQELLK